MIRVSKIMGESYDLDTGQELPKFMILTNGQKEVLIPVSDDDLQKIVLLLTPTSETTQSTAQTSLEPTPIESEELGEVHSDYWDPETGLESV